MSYENLLLAKIVAVKKKKEEPWDLFIKRRHRMGKPSYYDFGGTPIVLRVLQKILTVACVLADKGKQEFHNILEDATTWKDSQLRFTLQAIGMQDDPTQRKLGSIHIQDDNA